MPLIWTRDGSYRRINYASESDLEATILQVQTELFGVGRIYLDIKRKIGSKSGIRNIPDGYLLDLSGRKPRLYVVENELASHEPLRHIAVQILEFSLSFETDQRVVKAILFNALQEQPIIKRKCEEYASTHEFRNLDHMLEYLVYEAPFAALVVIDEIPEDLENVLTRRFRFGVEVLELARYENDKGDRLYHFEPFLADLVADVVSKPEAGEQISERIDLNEVDTVVVPARDDGFEDVFLGENRWYEIRVHGTMRPQIKYIAAYRVDPPVETFHPSVLHRTSRLNVYQLDLLLDAPCQKMPARQLRPVVAANRLRRPSFRHDPLQHPRHAPTCKTGVHFQCQALSCVRVHHAQHPDRSPAFHRVVHKVQRPFLIRRCASSQRLSRSHAVLALLAPDTQSCLPIHSMHSFVVHRFSAASQQNMQAPIAKPRLLPRLIVDIGEVLSSISHNAPGTRQFN